MVNIEELGERDRIVKQIRWARGIEEDRHIVLERTLVGYIGNLRGLKHLLEYLRQQTSNLKSNTILDVGAGLTIAISELERLPLGKGFNFLATVLKGHPEIEVHLGMERVHITSVERLRGVRNKSIACVLGVFSIAYSASPRLAIQQIDRVLVPGGILKASFQHSEFVEEEHKIRTHHEFTSTLKELGYDVAIIENTDDEAEIVLAIKPGLNGISAKELINQDNEDWEEQIKEVE